jgi:hypothetical protein
VIYGFGSSKCKLLFRDYLIQGFYLVKQNPNSRKEKHGEEYVTRVGTFEVVDFKEVEERCFTFTF